ncbi:MAG TPA: large-conductance mechanosensitive channel protein MscL [Dysgonamonadaceae bacterium]|jgi:large conductance mechanosensitive channel|uniref:large-conductance mechanosensitive channel protein MscL n=1 Tax=Gelidibacter sp. TaxID=2018083 RepID=UPI002D189016|nr:large-conductance mechanosensitive channel protein MscL [Gelidibacter sp.]HKM43912.1 large-conductance mechanosensitive channel protein MscL [Dysgonamonadaceae bacterium]HXJ99986.1 large-conductance mechanosensitive channel protein MscL [Gelidibacter sp.]
MALGKELKEFMLRGNVIDMAVGIVIGGAFGKIVTSFVNDILMPPISMLLGDTRVSEMNVVLKKAVMSGEEILNPAITWNYGMFLQNIMDFLIIGISIFMVIKGINNMRRKKEEEPAPKEEPAPTPQESLLMEIRDLLKKD